MSSLQEWEHYKLKKLERLRASTFTFAEYKAPSAEWDHDHCEGCWAKFAESNETEVLRRGYFTTVKIDDEAVNAPAIIQNARESGQKVLAKPDSKIWVCQECFDAFHTSLGWKLEETSKI